MAIVDTEHKLAGIDVTRDTLDAACVAFGTPSQRDTHDWLESDSRGAFTLAHVGWSLGDIGIAVVTRVAADHEWPEEVVAIRLRGHGMGYQTGAGLKPGDSLADAIARYGPPLSEDPPSFKFADGGCLSLGVRDGQIVEIQLMSPWLAGGSRAERTASE